MEKLGDPDTGNPIPTTPPRAESNTFSTGVTDIVLDNYTEDLFSDTGIPTELFSFYYVPEDARKVHQMLFILRRLLAIDPVLASTCDKYCMEFGQHIEKHKQVYPMPIELHHHGEIIIHRIAWTEDQLIFEDRSLRSDPKACQFLLGYDLHEYLLILQEAIAEEVLE